MPSKSSDRAWRDAAVRQVARVVGPIVCVASVVSPRLAGIENPWRVTLPELALALGLMLGGLAGSLRFEVRASLVIGAGVGLAWLLSLVYGPSAEVGIAQFVPVLGASLLLGRRAGFAVLGFTSSLMVVTGVVLTHGLVSDAFPHVLTRETGAALHSTRTWLRIAIAWSLGAAAVAIVVQAMIDHVAESRDEAERALERAQKEQEARERALRERARAADALLETERALASAQRLETVGRLVGGVAHDFNNALLVVLAWADLLRRRAPTPDLLGQGLDAIEQAASQAANTSRQLLAVARRHVRAPRSVDVGDVVRNAVRSFARLFPADYRVETEIEEGCTVLLDDSELHQILLNLALNARDAMEHGGTIRIRVAHVDGHEGEFVQLVVGDAGKGMDEATVGRIFEPFFSTKGESGTGLGLAMVRRTVEDARGTISVRSRPGEGTEFTIRFPIHHEPRSEGEPRSFETVLLSGRTILYVEDEEIARRAMVPALEHAGLVVLEARDGDEAIAIARRHRTPIDILCTDGIMPGLSTGQLIDGFKRLFPDACVLICSGYLESDLLRKGVEEGRYAFVAKPYNGTELVARIHGELERERRRRGRTTDSAIRS